MMSIQSIFIIILCILILHQLIEWIEYGLFKSQIKNGLPEKIATHINQDSYKEHIKYLRTNRRFSLIESNTQFLILLGFILGSGFTKFNNLIAVTNPIIHALIFLLGLGFINSIISMPFDWYRTFNIEEKYGFNKTTVRTFIADRIKGLGLSLLIGVPLIYSVLWILTNLDLAWIWASGVVIAFQLVMMAIGPTVIMPLFNTFSPIKDEQLKAAILTLGKTCSFNISNVFSMDGSRRSKKSNAFFVGFGQSKRVVLFDTLISRFSSNQILAVIAHEIGHYKHSHLQKLLAWQIMLTIGMFYLLDLCATSTQLSLAFGFESYSIGMNLIAFSFLFSPISLLIGILGNYVSRLFEYQADRYAAQNTSKKDLADSLIQLHNDNYADLNPHPVIIWLNYSHPSLAQRLDHLQYDPI